MLCVSSLLSLNTPPSTWGYPSRLTSPGPQMGFWSSSPKGRLDRAGGGGCGLGLSTALGKLQPWDGPGMPGSLGGRRTAGDWVTTTLL